MNFDWSFKKRLYLSFGAVAVLVLLLSVFAYWQFLDVGADLERFRMLRKNQEKIRGLQRNVLNLWQYVTDASLTQDEEVLYTEARPNYERALAKIEKLKKEKTLKIGKRLDEIETSLEAVWQSGREMFEAYEQSKSAGDERMEDFDKASQDLLKRTDELVELAERASEKAAARSSSTVVSSRRVAVVAGGLVVVISLGLAYFLVGFLTDKLDEFTRLFSNAAQGDLGVRYPLEDVNCSQIMQCGKEGCDEYGETGVLCWLDVGDKAPEFGREVQCPKILDGVYDTCEECVDVYQRVCKDEVDTLGAWFNKYMQVINLFGDKVEAIARDDLEAGVLGKELPGGLGEVARRLERQLEELADQAEIIAAGRLYSDELNTEGGGTLADSFAKMIEKQQKIARQAEALADFNLAGEELRDEVEGVLGEAFHEMVESLEKFVVSIRQGANKTHSVSEEVSSASVELSKASQDLSESAEEQSSSLEETSASVEEMASMLEQTANNSDNCEKLGEEAAEIAERGENQIDRMVEKMEQINEDSNEIADAVELIDDIAFQTNLLALNAAVEAANAGEHGAGFAVVADEVRQLAQRSSEAADDIGEVIEKSTERIEEGTREAHQSREVLGEIEGKVEGVLERIREIAAATNEQSSGIEEINQAITRLEQVTDNTTANAEESASSSEQLQVQADTLEQVVRQLRENVSKFRLRAELEQNGNDDISGVGSASAGDGTGDQPAESDLQTEQVSEPEDIMPLEKDAGGFD